MMTALNEASSRFGLMLPPSVDSAPVGIQCILKTRGRETACLSTPDTGLSDYAPGETLPMEVSFGLSKNANV